MRKLIFVFLLFSFMPRYIQGQNLTGTWVGHSSMDFLKLVIIHQGDSVFGYTYDEGPGWCQASFIGHYQRGEKHLKGKGIELLGHSGDHEVGLYKLKYVRHEGKEHLNGTVQLKLPAWSIFRYGLPTQVFLHRDKTEVDTIAYMRSIIDKQQPASKNPIATQKNFPEKADSMKQMPATIASNDWVKKEKEDRSFKVVQHIFTEVDSVKIALYDNGEVDQDSVTIFFDGAIILNRYMISDKAKELTIAIPKDGKEHSLDLFAHNLGNIPPNTALIIITAGKKRYELRASYDLSTNARIIFSHHP